MKTKYLYRVTGDSPDGQWSKTMHMQTQRAAERTAEAWSQPHETFDGDKYPALVNIKVVRSLPVQWEEA